MPQIRAAKKALRSNKRRRAVNDRWRWKMREAIHGVRKAMAEGNEEEAREALNLAASRLDRAARRNVIHPNKAARQKSRLQKQVYSIHL